MDPDVQAKQGTLHCVGTLRKQIGPLFVRRYIFRNFDKSKVELLLQQNKIPFYQVSACTGEGVENMFFGIIDQINELNENRNKLIRQQNQAQQTVIHQNQQTVTETLGYEAPPSTRVAMRLHDNEEEPLNPVTTKKKGCCF